VTRLRAVPSTVWSSVGALAFLASAGLALVLGAGLQVWGGAGLPARPSLAVRAGGHPGSAVVTVPGRPERPVVPSAGQPTAPVTPTSVAPIVPAVVPASAPQPSQLGQPATPGGATPTVAVPRGHGGPAELRKELGNELQRGLRSGRGGQTAVANDGDRQAARHALRHAHRRHHAGGANAHHRRFGPGKARGHHGHAHAARRHAHHGQIAAHGHGHRDD